MRAGAEHSERLSGHCAGRRVAGRARLTGAYVSGPRARIVTVRNSLAILVELTGLPTLVRRVLGAGVLAIHDAVAVGIDGGCGIPRALILAIVDAVAVGVHVARIDAGIGRVVRARVGAVGN